MTPEEVTPTEALAKALGFQPTKVARKREAEWAVRRAGTAMRDLQSRYYKQLARAIVRDDDIDHIWQEIDAHNAQRPADQWIVIHGPSLRQAVRQELYGVEARDRGAPRKARERLEEIRETRP